MGAILPRTETEFFSIVSLFFRWNGKVNLDDCFEALFRLLDIVLCLRMTRRQESGYSGDKFFA
jgi:hypothetical protein